MAERMTREEVKKICYPVQEMGYEKCGEDSFYCPNCPFDKLENRYSGA